MVFSRYISMLEDRWIKLPLLACMLMAVECSIFLQLWFGGDLSTYWCLVCDSCFGRVGTFVVTGIFPLAEQSPAICARMDKTLPVVPVYQAGAHRMQVQSAAVSTCT